MDGDTGQVGPGIANQLGIPQLTYVFKIREIDFEQGSIKTERLLEEGREVVQTTLPALLTVVKDINQPRYPTGRALRKARRADIPIWGADELEANGDLLGMNGSPTQVIKVFTPPKPKGGRILQGEVPDAVRELLKELRDAGLAIGAEKGRE